MNGICLSDVMLRKEGPGTDQYYLRSSNPPTHPGGMHGPMPQYFALPDQRRIERVPRPQNFSPEYESIPAITFSVNGYPGVTIANVWNGAVTVDAANDPVFGDQFESFVINFAWPGYDPRSTSSLMCSTIRARHFRRSISRQHLVKEICVALYNFRENVTNKRCPVAPGFEKWSLTGPQDIRGSRIILFSLHYYQTVWVPEFYVME